jgi:hypothetical protein
MTAIIRSIQTTTLQFGTTPSTASVAITAVERDNSFILVTGQQNNGGSADLFSRTARFTLESSVLIAANRQTTNNTIISYNLTVIEFESTCVNLIQHGTIAWTTAATTVSQAITAVSSRAFIVNTGYAYNGGPLAAMSRSLAGFTLQSSVLVQGQTCTGSTSGRTGNFTVVDLTSNVVESVQQIALTANSSSATDVTTIAAVDIGRTLLIDGGRSFVTNTITSTGAQYTAELASTSVTFTRSCTATTISRTHFASVVTFAPQAVGTTVQRGTLSIPTSLTSTTLTITGVSTRAFVNGGPFNFRGETTAGNIAFCIFSGVRTRLLTTDSVVGVVNSTTTGLGPRLASYEVFDFSTGVAAAASSYARESNLDSIECGLRRGLHPIDHGVRPYSIIQDSV